MDQVRNLFSSAVLVMALLGTGAAEAAAQSRHLSVEVNPVHATVGYGRVSGSQVIRGYELGFGFPQLDRTLAPDDDTLLDFLHLGMFVRTPPSGFVLFTGRAQLGLAELRGCSGCFPGLFAAVSGGAFVGTRYVKVGPRLTTGVIKEQAEPATLVVNLTPIAVMISITW